MSALPFLIFPWQRPLLPDLKNYLAAAGAGSVEHLALAAGRVLAGITAGLAALGLVLETTAGVELLLAGGPNELLAAILAYQSLVFEHSGYLLCVYFARGRI